MPPLQLLYLKYRMLFSDVTCGHLAEGLFQVAQWRQELFGLGGGMSFHLSSARNNLMEKGNTGEEV